MITSITIIGAGRVGRAMGIAFFEAGFDVELIISKSSSSAESLANHTKSRWSTDLSQEFKSDMIFIAVPDNALKDVIASLGEVKKSLIVHSAGSYGINIFDPLSCAGKGVFYPLQTFTIGRDINMLDIPLLIEADSAELTGILLGIAKSLSSKVYEVGEDDRRMVHLAAVFVCNFVNHIYHAGEEIIRKTDLPFSVLGPLIDETLSKAITIGPGEAQTGPALRNDISTIEKHLDLLSYSPELRDIYDTITRSIIKNKLSG